MALTESTDSTDPRVHRSRTALQSALLDLTGRVAFDLISISDITAEAGLSRSTFYDHYTSKDQLLVDAIDAQLARAGIAIYSGGLLTTQEDQDSPPAVLVDYVCHVYEHPVLYRLVLGPNASNASHSLRSKLTEVIESGYDVLGVAAPDIGSLPRHIDAAAMTGAMLAILEAAIFSPDPASADTVAGWIWEVFCRV